MLAKSWYEPIDMIAEGLGSEVVSYEAKHDFILANQPIETAVGIIEEGTIALNHYRHIGRTREGTEIVQEQIWYVDDIEQTRLQSEDGHPARVRLADQARGRREPQHRRRLPAGADPGRARGPGALHHRLPPGERGAPGLRGGRSRAEDLPGPAHDHRLHGHPRHQR